MKILIVDDQKIFRHQLLKNLDDVGTCVAVSDGLTAVQAFKESLDCDKKFDVVILDLYMPNMNGFKTLEIMRTMESFHSKHTLTKYKYSRIVIHTSSSDPRDILISYQKKSNGFLSKPVSKEELIKKITGNF